MNGNIEVIAFDADDTLWVNEPFFQDAENQFTALLRGYGTAEQISEELFKTETDNLKCLGYGAKAFTISMIETALRIGGESIGGDVIQKIILLGKSLLEIPAEPMKDVCDTLRFFKEKGDFRLIIATKGDLTDQQNKLQRSGLSHFFDHIEVMSDKKRESYLQLLNRLQVLPENFVMIGNSFKSDIAPVLDIGAYAVHIPFEIMWKHEDMESFEHPNLKCLSCFGDLAKLF